MERPAWIYPRQLTAAVCCPRRPDNLISVSEEMLLIKILDFGIAAATERGGMRDTLVTGTGGLAAQIGTPHYMSPEAFGDDTVDART